MFLSLGWVIGKVRTGVRLPKVSEFSLPHVQSTIKFIIVKSYINEYFSQ